MENLAHPYLIEFTDYDTYRVIVIHSVAKAYIKIHFCCGRCCGLLQACVYKLYLVPQCLTQGGEVVLVGFQLLPVQLPAGSGSQDVWHSKQQ